MIMQNPFEIIFKYTNGYLWIFAAVFLLTYFYLSKRRQKLPPGPIGIPVLGYSPFLTKDQHIDFYKLSKKYGDIYGLYLGKAYVVVIADYNIAKELFKEMAASDRPHKAFAIMPGGVGFAGLNGDEWLEQRRYTIQKLKNLGFGTSRWETWVQIEVQNFVELLVKKGGHSTNIDKPLMASISNLTMTLVTGNWLPMGDPKREITDAGVQAFERTMNQGSSVTSYPLIYKLAVFFGFINAKDKLKSMLKFHEYVRQIIEERNEDDEESESYVQDYLKEIKKRNKQNLSHTFNLHNLIGNAQALIIAGSDTTKISLLWLFYAMASHPDIQNKVHQELNNVNGEISSWEDRRKLPYCHATILEGQRWRTIAPLNVLHSLSKDIAVGEFIIPKGTRILSLNYAYHMDPHYWKDPEKFRPERFLDEDGAVIQNIENYAAFSFGKRQCMGKTVAYIEIFSYFVGIMQKFKVLPSEDSAVLDLNGELGLNLHPKDQNLRFILK